MKTRLFLLISLSLFSSISSTASPADLTGRASIIDGDTLEIHGTRIRLWGIDAPESDQLCRSDDSEHYRCGQKAANDLDALIARRPVDCVEVDRDQYRRTVAVCAVAGIDLVGRFAAIVLVRTALAGQIV